MRKIKYYIDGACMNKKGVPMSGVATWACVVVENGKVKEVVGNSFRDATNNMAELYAGYTAITKAANIICRNRLESVSIKIYSDSGYFVDGMKEEQKKWYVEHSYRKENGEEIANADIWRKIYKKYDAIKDYLENGDSISIEWVKAHNGDSFNELADRHTKKLLEKIAERN